MTKTRQTLIHELNHAIQKQGTLTVLFTHAIAQHIGLSATEFEFCDVLQNQGQTSAGELAKLCGLSSGGVTGLVDRLEKAGLVRRVPDPSDRRRVIIKPIERNDLAKTIGDLYRPLSEAFQDLVQSYSTEELEIILNFISRTIQMTENAREKLSLDQ
jgi:DNA-binding MarR family transcriptional regulator